MIYNNHNKLYSIINESYDIKTIFEIIINFFDPFKNKNYKPKVLDMSNSYYWTEKNINRFDLVKTNNIEGYAKEKKYNIIIYEPPRNKKFDIELNNYSNNFYNLLYKNGIVIVRVGDFRYNGKIKGSFDIKEIFENYNFYLYDNIIYKNQISYDKDSYIFNNYSKIIHSNFLIFKRQKDIYVSNK